MFKLLSDQPAFNLGHKLFRCHPLACQRSPILFLIELASYLKVRQRLNQFSRLIIRNRKLHSIRVLRNHLIADQLIEGSTTEFLLIVIGGTPHLAHEALIGSGDIAIKDFTIADDRGRFFLAGLNVVLDTPHNEGYADHNQHDPGHDSLSPFTNVLEHTHNDFYS